MRRGLTICSFFVFFFHVFFLLKEMLIDHDKLTIDLYGIKRLRQKWIYFLALRYAKMAKGTNGKGLWSRGIGPFMKLVVEGSHLP